MTRSSLWVVAYDISEDRERDQAERVLLGFGFRVQKSVFECRITRGQGKQLKERLACLSLQTGFVVIYRSAGAQRIAAIGADPPPPPDAEAAFVV